MNWIYVILWSKNKEKSFVSPFAFSTEKEAETYAGIECCDMECLNWHYKIQACGLN